MRLSPEWLAAHDRRNRQLARGEAELERDVKALPGHITGEPRADDMRAEILLQIACGDTDGGERLHVTGTLVGPT